LGGESAVASGSYSIASGRFTTAFRPFQQAHGNGRLGSANNNGSQWSRYIISAQCVDGVPISLTSIGQNFALDPDTAYLVTVKCIANQVGVDTYAAFERTMLIHRTGAAAVIDQDIAGGNNAALNMGTGWTLVLSATGANIDAVFTGGGAGDAINVTLTYEWVECDKTL